MQARRVPWRGFPVAVACVVLGCSSSNKATSGADTGGPTTDGGGSQLRDAADATQGFVSHDAGSDCGGRTGNPCGDGAACSMGTDCQSGVCTGGLCVAPAPSCSDGKKDGQETDVDCGGPACPACASGKACLLPRDCTSEVCTGDACQAPTDTDGVKNDSETDVDCGGALQASGAPNPSSDGAPPCAPGKQCQIPSDCAQGVCNAAPVSLVDAGPDAAGRTADGSVGRDAGASGVLYCQPASPTDGVENDSETDVDCGGVFLASGSPNPASDGAPPCAEGQKCQLGTDCSQGVCNANAGQGGGPINCPGGACTCQAPSSNDGVKNDSETDVDCGGATSPGSDGAPPCAPGLHCMVDADCQSFICGTNGLCTAPSPTDGVKNDSETDVDCGGALVASGQPNPSSDGAPPCKDAKTCALDTDCLSLFCSLISKTCVDGQSCKGLAPTAPIQDIVGCFPPATCPAGSTCDTTLYDCIDNTKGDVIGTPDANGVGQNAGIDTCGVGESTDPVAGQTHESCCKSLVLPNSSMRLDKYEITAGRMRQFAASLNYDIYDWANAQVAAATTAGQTLSSHIPSQLIALLPKSADPTVPMNAVVQLGATTIDALSAEQGCFVKGAVGTTAGAAGASVYWWDSTTLDGVGSPPRPFTQDYYDIKSMNCALYQMYAAFCAWDGGHIATGAELGEAYGSGTYPWGNATIPSPYPYKNMVGQVNPYCGGTVNATYPNVSMINTLLAPGQSATTVTVNWLNSNNAGNEGCFYYYPSFINSNPTTSVPDSFSNGLDFSPQIAAPGRFYLDVSSAKSPGTTEGWQDLGANNFDAGEMNSTGTNTLCDCTGVTGPGDNQLPTCPCAFGGNPTGVLRAQNLGGYFLEGGSWEGHTSFNPAAAAYWELDDGSETLAFQYGKIGARCARPVEPTP